MPRRTPAFDTRFNKGRQADLTALEYGRRDAVARRDTELPGRPAYHLQYSANRPAGRDKARRQGLCVFRDTQDSAIAADEHHIERNIGVLHPEADFLLTVEVEQHSLPFGQFPAIHETFCSLRIVVGDFDGERMHPGLAGDLQRLLSCRPYWGNNGEQADESKDG